MWWHRELSELLRQRPLPESEVELFNFASTGLLFEQQSFYSSNGVTYTILVGLNTNTRVIFESARVNFRKRTLCVHYSTAPQK